MERRSNTKILKIFGKKLEYLAKMIEARLNHIIDQFQEEKRKRISKALAEMKIESVSWENRKKKKI